MKIYIEAGSFYGQRSGVGRFGISLVQELTKLRPKDDFVLFSFLRPGRHVAIDFKELKNQRVKYIRWFPGRLFSLMMRLGISLPLEIFGLEEADVVIFPNFISWASASQKRRVAVVHDLSFLYYPNFINSKNLRYLNVQLTKSIRRSAKIVAVSEATKDDLIKNYGVGSDKISVVHNSIDHSIFNPMAAKKTFAVKKRFGIPEKYILFAGNIEPRKNIVGLLTAYAETFSQHRLPLVLVGGKGWKDEQIEITLKKYSDLPIIRLGFVQDSDLAPIYAGASVFVFPSFYEGFGIPPLEAMACGCPVICSGVSSLPEIVGDAALLVDPRNNQEISEAIIKLVNNRKLQEKLIKSGYVQSRKFTWGNSALKFSKIIDEL